MDPATVPDQKSVFLNVPFDKQYRPLFTALVASLTALGRSPRCVLEVPSSGKDRLERIVGLIRGCGSSIHDLSRVTFSSKSFRVPRFNMPFELGIAYMLAQQGEHSFFLLEAKEYRLLASLSDLNGHEPHIHHGTQAGVLAAILDCFGTPEGTPALAELRSLTARLSKVVLGLQKEQGVDHPFKPFLFRQMVQAAADLASAERLIE